MSESVFVSETASAEEKQFYRVQVFHGQVFRLPQLEMQHFVVDLDKDHMKKAPYINSLDVQIKLKELLREGGLPSLGYSKGVVPEEDWLFQVARKIDQNNSTAIFTKAVPHPVIQCNRTKQMLCAKKNASTL